MWDIFLTPLLKKPFYFTKDRLYALASLVTNVVLQAFIVNVQRNDALHFPTFERKEAFEFTVHKYEEAHWLMQRIVHRKPSGDKVVATIHCKWYMYLSFLSSTRNSCEPSISYTENVPSQCLQRAVLQIFEFQICSHLINDFRIVDGTAKTIKSLLWIALNNSYYCNDLFRTQIPRNLI